MDSLENKVIAAATPEAAQEAITEAQAQQATSAAAQFLASGMKPGWQTTEFWLAAAVIVGTAGGIASAFIPAPWGVAVGIAAGGLVSIGYSKNRAEVKAKMLPALADLAKAIQDAKGFKK